MADAEAEFNGLFSVPGEAALPPEIMGELQSTARMHSISAQELFYKWESYCIKMGSEQTKLDLETIRAFKKDVQEILERDTRGKTQTRGPERRNVHATPRAAAHSDDVFGMLEGITPSSARTVTASSAKRKAPFETPAQPKAIRSAGRSSPTDGRTPTTQTTSTIPFVNRTNAGQIVETLNDHLSSHEAPIVPPAEPRIKLKVNSDLPRFAYKPLAMHLSEASAVLDDRIDEITLSVQKLHKLDDSAIGSAASKSTNEIVAVGRITSDTSEGKLNAASIVLEMSRRAGAGLRVPLKFAATVSAEFFPGQIVAVRGINASGEYFSVTEVLEIPQMPTAVTLPSTINATNERLGIDNVGDANPSQALNIVVSAGPYTADDNLDYEPLHALCEKAIESSADVLILVGPLLDIEHPLVATGDFDLPDDAGVEPDRATLNDVFRILIGEPLRRLAQTVPSITILTVPSARDAVNKHVAWPQNGFSKKELGLPKQAKAISNPIMVALNEIVVGISGQDILYDLRREEVNIGMPKETNLMARLPKHVIQQGHFFPLFPPTDRTLLPKPGLEDGVAIGTPLDTSYLILGEWPNIKPDVLVLPSALPPFAKVVENVLVLNPGTLSKRKGPGTYAQMAVHPRKLTEEEQAAPNNMVANHVFDRARVDIIRI